MPMKFINLTPHDVTVYLPDTATETNRRRTFHRDGTVARVSQIASTVKRIDGISIDTVKFGPVVGLPQPVDGTLFIVSAMVKTAAGDRTDLVSPGELVRDAAGNTIGCKSFYC